MMLPKLKVSDGEYYFIITISLWCFHIFILDGKFGAYMQVHIQNDGPVTIELESPVEEPKNKSKTSGVISNESVDK